MKRLLPCLLLAVALPVHAELFDAPADVATIRELVHEAFEALDAAAGLEGRFEQRKTLPQLPRPLVSRGEFVYAQGHGIWWHTQTPFESTLILRRDGLSQQYGGQTEVSQDAGAAAVSQIFFALLALDFESLDRSFELYGEAGEHGWRVGLVPRQAALAEVLGRAIVEGDRSVTRVQLVERDDRTEFLFQDVQILTRELSQAELQRFQ